MAASAPEVSFVDGLRDVRGPMVTASPAERAAHHTASSRLTPFMKHRGWTLLPHRAQALDPKSMVLNLWVATLLRVD